MTEHLTDSSKEELCREMAAAGLLEPGERQRWRCTAKGHLWGSALCGIALAAQYNGEPNPGGTRDTVWLQ